MHTQSLAEQLAALPSHERSKIINGFDDDVTTSLKYDWEFWARTNQLPPDWDWQVWLILTGRAWGKTVTGAQWIRSQVKNGASHIALVAPTAADVRDVMVEGPSGILTISPDHERPEYEPSKRRLTWPNGAVATTYSAEEPERLRGPQHAVAWCDELCAWRFPEAWDMLMFGLRVGEARCLVTTTPKPTRLVRDLVKRSDVAITRGTTYENRSNLAPAFFRQIVTKYEGTRLGRQELNAELLEEAEGALWTRDMLEACRCHAHPDLRRIVVAIDPAVTSNEQSDETGMVVAGIGDDGRGYLLEDLSGRLSPASWAERAINAYNLHKADRIIGEVNNGGDMVGHTISTSPGGQNVAFKAIHASKGKAARAEPIAALYEQGRIKHVGSFPDLEDQQSSWEPLGKDRSPDRLDAVVWAFTELMLDAEPDLSGIEIGSLTRVSPWKF